MNMEKGMLLKIEDCLIDVINTQIANFIGIGKMEASYSQDAKTVDYLQGNSVVYRRDCKIKLLSK